MKTTMNEQEASGEESSKSQLGNDEDGVDMVDKEHLLKTSSKSNENSLLVEFSEGDTKNPFNWSTKKKLWHTAIYGLATFSAQFNSTTTSPSVSHIAEHFNVSREKALLSTSLYVLGIAFGPMFFAPLSEMYGRKIAIFGSLFVSLIFTLGSASSKDFAALLTTRFFAGFFGGSPVVSSGGVLSDFWSINVRSIAMVFYALFVVCGTTLGPVVCSLLTFQVGGSEEWRWPLWFICMVQGLFIIIAIFTVSESHSGVLLTHKAKETRKRTGNWAYHAKHEEWDLDFNEYLSTHLLRPFAMLATPIVFFLALFASYVFGILYLIVTSVPMTFKMTRGWEGTVSNLPMLSVFVGILFGAVANIWGGLRYKRVLVTSKGVPIPEERFPPMMMFAWLMPAGLFIFAWTSWSHIHWIAPCIGLSCTAFGFFVIFQGCLNYLVDAFTKYAASAIAANTFFRSILAAVFPLFGSALFGNLGVHWGASTIAFVALGMIPIPFVFYAFGSKIRSKNPYSKRID